MTLRDRGIRRAAVCAAAVWLAACTGTEDPSRAGFFDGVRNLGGGAYDRRAADQDRRLQEAERIKRELQADVTVQQERNRRQQQEIVALQGRVSEMERGLAGLERQLEDLRRRDRADPQVADAERRVQALRREQQALARQPSPPPERVDRVGRELDNMAETLKRLNRPE